MTNRNELERLLADDKAARAYGGFPDCLAEHLRNNAQHYLSLMDEVERLRASLGRQKQAWENVRELGLMPFTHDNNVLDLIDDARQALGETHDR